MMKILYRDSFFTIAQHEDYENIPGFYVIRESNCDWNISMNGIKKLAELEQTIRQFLLELGVDLVGIYREYKENKICIYIIPYHIDILQEMNISPDLYQPYIEEYLKNFPNSKIKKVEEYNKLLVKRMKEGGN